MEGIINFHHDLFFFLTAILFFVFYLFVRCLMLFNKKANPKPIIVTHAPLLEII
jgi:cytochrome c oxidase subunit 2